MVVRCCGLLETRHRADSHRMRDAMYYTRAGAEPGTRRTITVMSTVLSCREKPIGILSDVHRQRHRRCTFDRLRWVHVQERCRKHEDNVRQQKAECQLRFEVLSKSSHRSPFSLRLPTRLPSNRLYHYEIACTNLRTYTIIIGH